MIPTEEETQKIQEAQLANPDTPLGSAEQFLLILSSISELSARLQLWAFKMDYDALEKVSLMFCYSFIQMKWKYMVVWDQLLLTSPLKCQQEFLMGLVHPKMNKLSSITHYHVVPNP